MTFAAQLKAFADDTTKKEAAVFVATVVEVKRSWVEGSPVTGAPAIPVAPSEFPRAGALRDSVTVAYPDPDTAIIYTEKLYAPDVETNPKGHTFNNGGPHGHALTVAGFPHLLAMVTERITGHGR